MDWLKKIYEWCNFQNRYDAIKGWKLSPAQQKLSDMVWKNLSPNIQKALWALITIIITKYGEDAGIALWEKFLVSIKNEGLT